MGLPAPPLGPLPARIAGHFLRPGQDDDRKIARRLVGSNPSETVDRAVATLAMYLKMATKNNRRDAAVYGAILSLFADTDLHKFVVRVMKENTLRNGPLHAAVRFNYLLFTPFLLLDYVFSDTAKDELRTALKMFPRDSVIEVAVFAAEKFDDADAVIAKLSADECFRGRQLPAPRWTPYNVRRFIDAVSRTLDVAVPPEAKPVYAVVGIAPPLEAFLDGRMEPRDFVPIFRAYAGGDGALVDRLLGIVGRKSLFLASFVAERCGRPPTPYTVEFTPACAAPVNEKLHSLVDAGEIVIKDASNVSTFEFHLKESNYFAVDVHGVSDPLSVVNRVGLVSFCLRSKTYFLLPRLFPETVGPIAQVLKAQPRLTFVYRWGRFGPTLRQLLDWEPVEKIEAEKVAEEAGETFSLDLMTERVVGGTYCKRASDFSDAAIPSSTALRHNAIRVTLVYEFVVKMRRLRERAREKKTAEFKSRKRRDRENEGEDGRRRKRAE